MLVTTSLLMLKKLKLFSAVAQYVVPLCLKSESQNMGTLWS